MKKLLITLAGLISFSQPTAAQEILNIDYQLPNKKLDTHTNMRIERDRIVINSSYKNTNKEMLPYYVAMHVGAALDVATTYSCLKRDTCHETNPLYGRKPSLGKLILTRGGLSVLQHILVYEVAKKDTKDAKTLAVTMGIVSFGIAGLNARY